MTTEEKIQVLEENDIEYYIDKDGELMAFHKMLTFAGDDCSEWLNADDLVNYLKQQYDNNIKTRVIHGK